VYVSDPVVTWTPSSQIADLGGLTPLKVSDAVAEIVGCGCVVSSSGVGDCADTIGGVPSTPYVNESLAVTMAGTPAVTA
jgi:hypothetical protein